MEISNRIVIITGGTGGIGLCVTKEMIANGAKLVALFDLKNQKTLSAFNELRRDYGERVEFFECDVSNSKQLTENLDKVFETYKTIDILINNAGLPEKADPELLLDVNFKAVVLGSYAMIKRVSKENGGQGGVIVNIASVLGLMNCSLVPTYTAAKHGVVSFTKSMMDAYEKSGVRMVAVCPGFTVTPMVSNITQEYIGLIEAKYKVSFPMQKPENVASAVISIIKNGKSGDVWVSENDKPPYPANVVDPYFVKRK